MNGEANVTVSCDDNDGGVKVCYYIFREKFQAFDSVADAE
jgi:hypothetical protein